MGFPRFSIEICTQKGQIISPFEAAPPERPTWPAPQRRCHRWGHRWSRDSYDRIRIWGIWGIWGEKDVASENSTTTSQKRCFFLTQKLQRIVSKNIQNCLRPSTHQQKHQRVEFPEFPFFSPRFHRFSWQQSRPAPLRSPWQPVSMATGVPQMDC